MKSEPVIDKDKTAEELLWGSFKRKIIGIKDIIIKREVGGWR